MTLALYAPHKPRSDVMSTMPVLVIGLRRVNRRCICCWLPRWAARWVNTSQALAVYGRVANTCSWARRILLAATICMARVTWAIFLTLRMRRLISRTFDIQLPVEASPHSDFRSLRDFGSLAISLREIGGLFVFLNGSVQRGSDLVGQVFLAQERLADLSMDAAHKLKQAGFKILDLVDGHVVGKAIGHGKRADDLLVERHRRVLELLE